MSSNKRSSKGTEGNILDSRQLNELESMIKIYSKEQDLELEASIKNVNYESFYRVCKNLVKRFENNEENIHENTTLDITVLLESKNTLRVRLCDYDEINDFINRFSRESSSTIKRYISSLSSSKTVNIELKNRSQMKVIDLTEFNSNIKMLPEIPVVNSNKPSIDSMKNLFFRFKNRSTFIDKLLKFDVSEVQESNNLYDLINSQTKCEIEIEVTSKKIDANTFASEIENILKIVQDTDIPIGKTEASDITDRIISLLELRRDSNNIARNPVTLERHHIVNNIPNKYAVTDKADGDRYLMFIHNERAYLVSTNMVIKKTNIGSLDPAFNNTLIDGELITIGNNKAFMAFDVIYSNDIDYRFDDKYNLNARLIVLNKIIDKCFGNLIKFQDYAETNDDMDIKLIKKFYTKELSNYWKKFNDAYKKSNTLFVTRKLFFVPYGIDCSEVFMYADLLWRLSSYDNITPYELDGIIYTPINSPYSIRTRGRDNVNQEYKWKPPQLNSIDFFIRFIKDSKGEDVVYFDSASIDTGAKPYKVCVLHVGTSKGNREVPVPFRPNGVEQRANIYLTEDYAQDVKGNVIDDETVVEFVFDTSNPDIDDAFKWTALRTRHDKTESIKKYGKKYGNNLNVALNIWKTINEPITEDHITSLADISSYSNEMTQLSKNVTPKKQSFIYYQKKTGDAAGMRKFNNFIKSNIIVSYSRNKKRVLDVGCGRGGDIYKFTYAGVEEYIGLDIDNNGLFTIPDSALNRYKSMKKKIKDVPNMTFIQADAKAKFNSKSQLRVLPNMNNRNAQLIDKHLDSNIKYDIINAQFTLHYYLADELSWNNFCDNVNKCLENNGYLLITAFDGKLLADRLKGKKKLTISYTQDLGDKSIFAEINKIYSDDELKGNGIGLAIDLYNSMISEQGTYIREYLVLPDFLKQSLHDKCGLDLVESESFFNMFNLYKDYFESESVNIFDDAHTSYYKGVKQFYESLKHNPHSDVEQGAAMASFRFSMLNRYYVFKKTRYNDLTEQSRLVGVNHTFNLGKTLVPYFEMNRMMIDYSKKASNANKIYQVIAKKYSNVKPSVYLIRHTVSKDHIGSDYYVQDHINFDKIKDGKNRKTIVLYKSPEKEFYPIYQQVGSYGDFEDYVQNRTIHNAFDDNKISKRVYRTYLLNSDKVANDIDLLIDIHRKLREID